MGGCCCKKEIPQEATRERITRLRLELETTKRNLSEELQKLTWENIDANIVSTFAIVIGQSVVLSHLIVYPIKTQNGNLVRKCMYRAPDDNRVVTIEYSTTRGGYGNFVLTVCVQDGERELCNYTTHFTDPDDFFLPQEDLPLA